MLQFLPAAISAGTSIYNAFAGGKKEKEARKQSAESQRLAREADASAKTIANQRYQALDPFRNAAFAELSRSGTIRPEQYAAIKSGRYQGQVDSALDSVTKGPDRMALIRQAMADYDTQNARGLNDRFRSVGSNAAKFGRLGMQVNEQNVRDVAREYEQDRAATANEMMRQATDATVNDRYRTLGAVSGMNESNLGLQERNRAFDYGTKRDAVGDRQAAINTAQGLAGTGFDNRQVLDASQNRNTRDALDGAAGQNRQQAGQYGQTAGDLAGLAGRFLPIGAGKNNLALDPNMLTTAGKMATSINIPEL